MKKTSVVVALVASVLLLALGVIFLIAAASRPSRILVALVFLVFGGALLIWALLTLRRQAELSPESLATGTVDLARKLGGEVTVAQVQAEFRIPHNLALSVLETLCSRGDCEREQRADHYVYVFKSVMPAKAIKLCPYCGSTFAVRSAVRQCPNCGAALEISKE